MVCGGILVADHVCTPMEALPEAGSLVAVDRMFLLTGGCAANVAIDVARQGVGVSVVGCVGDDVWGRFVRGELERHGVGCAGLRVLADQQSSQTMVLLCRGEDRRFIHAYGANRALAVADLEREAPATARVFYLGGYLILPGILPAELGRLFRACRDRGVKTVLDVVVPSGFRYGGELEPVLPYTDLFLPNEDEGELLTGERDPERQIASLRARGAATVVVTLGSQGVVFAADGPVLRAPPYAVEVADQTGAGDAFAAGMVTGLVRGWNLARCVEYGSALGSSCVRSLGACDGVFTAAEAEQFVAAHPLPAAVRAGA